MNFFNSNFEVDKYCYNDVIVSRACWDREIPDELIDND